LDARLPPVTNHPLFSASAHAVRAFSRQHAYFSVVGFARGSDRPLRPSRPTGLPRACLDIVQSSKMEVGLALSCAYTNLTTHRREFCALFHEIFPMKIRLDELIVECDKCGGRGMRTEGSERMQHQQTCLGCLGRGKRLTEAGRVLRDFMVELDRGPHV
jgi:DnaJ-class molecular chaperone